MAKKIQIEPSKTLPRINQYPIKRAYRESDQSQRIIEPRGLQSLVSVSAILSRLISSHLY